MVLNNVGKGLGLEDLKVLPSLILRDHFINILKSRILWLLNHWLGLIG